MVQVIILPVELAALVPPGDSLLDAGERAGVEMEAGCCDGSCGACAVEVLSGPDYLVAPEPAEQSVLVREGFDPRRHRLACRARVGTQTDGIVRIRQHD